MQTGLKIKSLSRQDAFFEAGVRAGDRILSINGHALTDELDFYYHAAQPILDVEIARGDKIGFADVARNSFTPLEVEFHETPVRTCKNKCIFCFIDQMPKGLRSSLYIKDEDLKHSFLNGNYVTLTGASKNDLNRIVSIGLSPIFVSVHATDKNVRGVMLGNKRVPDIMEQLSFLRDNGIAFHTQIVLCPNVNDGAVLKKTVNDLFGFGDALLSIAVVPVGITKFTKNKLVTAVDKNCALKICNDMENISAKMRDKDGVRKLFIADEFFIRADLSIPTVSYYENYPQIENGVGLLRQLLQESEKIKRGLRKCHSNICVDKSKKENNFLMITGRSAYPYLKKIMSDISQYTNKNYDVVVVDNDFFGHTVTVAGLLTAKDVIGKIKKILRDKNHKKKYKRIILPSVMFNHAGYTLDGYSPNRIGKILNAKIKLVQTLTEIVS